LTAHERCAGRDNAAMRDINRKLGFEPIGEHVIFGRDL
jgi:hypothetical protein